MSRTSHRRGARAKPPYIHEPKGVFHSRVKKVGPEHFGIVTVDPAKKRSYWMLADFYGTVIVPKSTMEHTRTGFEKSLRELKDAIAKHEIHDLTVSIERTGNYHVRPKQMFMAAGYDTRILHGSATNLFRKGSNEDIKTDDTDLVAQHRATVIGFALIEPAADPHYSRLQLLTRHRRDLVEKGAALRCQIQDHLDSIMPGYTHYFRHLFEDDLALVIARHTGSAHAITRAGLSGLAAILRQNDTRFQERSLHKLLTWAGQAADSLDHADLHQRLWIALDDDRKAKARELVVLERQIAALLVATPYVLLMGIPGINVVSAADFAAEMGPITNYANPQSITGRAGVCPSRYQSDEVDYPNGRLIRCANRSLRAAVMRIADNLIACNQYFKSKAHTWSLAGHDPRAQRIRVACRFCRIAYHMVSGRMAFQHPSCQKADSLLNKLTVFHREHTTDLDQLLRDLKAAALQLAPSASTIEDPRLAEEVAEVIVQLHSKAKCIQTHGPRLLGDFLLDVLIQRGFHAVKSQASGE